MEKALPDFEPILPAENNLYHTLFHGGVLECFDVQAISAIQEGVGTYWYPQCLATIVIAADRDQTGLLIRGWEDLLTSGLEVSWNQSSTTNRMLLGAFCYGLEGENFTVQTALTRLREQYLADCFFENKWEKPVNICFDYQAAELMRQGRNLEIIVPEEGTLSFAMGLLSDRRLAAPSDEELLAGGLRLMDGRCTNPFFPEEEAYRPAHCLTDFRHLLEETAYTVSVIRRGVRRTRLYSSADGMEHIMYALLAVVLILLWMGTAVHRSIRPEIQRAVRIMAGLMAGWILLRLYKYQLPEMMAVGRFCWYGYYIFQMALPLTMLYVAAVFDRPESGGKPPKWFRVPAVLYPLLLVLVFTNDWHQWVFQFDLQNSWSDEYTYGIGYYLVFAYCFLTFFSALFLLIRKSRKSPRRGGWVLPVLVSLLIVFYAAGYALGIPLARNSDLTLTLCVLSVLFFEAALHTGLLPANSRYDLLFESSPLDMQLLDKKGRTVLAASSAAALEPVQRIQLQSKPSVSISRDADTVLFGREIRGGTAVWQEDVGTLNRLHEEVRASIERMEAANAFLRRESEIRRQQVAADVKAELSASLEQEIKARTEKLSQAIQELPQAEDRERQIACITLLLCHIKRRCNLFFLAQEGQWMDGSELMMYLDELSEFAGYAGVRALVQCALPAQVDVRTAVLCYDFYFSALDWSAQKSRATLLGQLEQTESGLNFRLLSSEKPEPLFFSEDFIRRAEAAGGQVFCRMVDEMTGIYLNFSNGGAQDE